MRLRYVHYLAVTELLTEHDEEKDCKPLTLTNAGNGCMTITGA